MKLIVGIGNKLRGDDWAGCWVAKKLEKELTNPSVNFLTTEESPESWAPRIGKMNPDEVILLDAMKIGLEPGEVKLCKPNQIIDKIPSTHSASLQLVADYLKLHEIPLTIIGIEPKIVQLRSKLSKKVKESYPKVKKMVKKLL